MYADLIDKFVVVRSSQSGVWFGRLQQVEGDDARLQDARRVYNWEGAASCSGLATGGPSGGQICAPVATAVVKGFCECLGASDEAAKRFAEVSPWVVK